MVCRVRLADMKGVLVLFDDFYMVVPQSVRLCHLCVCVCVCVLALGEIGDDDSLSDTGCVGWLAGCLPRAKSLRD